MHKKGKKLVHSVQQALFYRSNAGEKNTGLCKKKKKRCICGFTCNMLSFWADEDKKPPKTKPQTKNPRALSNATSSNKPITCTILIPWQRATPALLPLYFTYVVPFTLLPLHVKLESGRLLFLTPSFRISRNWDCHRIGVCSRLVNCHIAAENFCPSWSFGFLVRGRQKTTPKPATFSEQSIRKNKPQPKIPSPPPNLMNAMRMIASQMHTHCTSKMKTVRGSKGEFR